MLSTRWQVEEIAHEEGLRKLRAEWTELLEHSRVDTPFLTWEWLSCWLRHLAGNRAPAILTVRDRGTLLGIAPWIRRPGILSSLEFMGTGAVGSDYLDVIARREFEGAVLSALAERLVERNESLFLHGILADSSVCHDLSRRLDDAGWTHARQEIGVCPYVDLSAGDWDEYLAGLSSSHRYNFRRRCRQLERDFDVSFERPESARETADALQVLVDLHLQRWDDRGGSDALHRDALVAFHRDFVQHARDRGWLRLYVLRLDGRPAAALYGLLYGGRFYFYQSGFDPEFSKYSPSLVTLGLTIQDAMEEGAREYDLLHGDERYKFHWTERTRTLETVECHPPGLTSALVRNGRRLSAAARGAAREFLPEPVIAALSDIRDRRA